MSLRAKLRLANDTKYCRAFFNYFIMRSKLYSILISVAPRVCRPRLPRATLAARNIGAARMVSGALTNTTVVGQDGRKYKRTDALKVDPRKPERLNVYVTE